jgi:hypothetical protein
MHTLCACLDKIEQNSQYLLGDSEDNYTFKNFFFSEIRDKERIAFLCFIDN